MSIPAAAIPALLVAEDAIVYNTVAASAFTFWEHCITFGQEEVDLIWRTGRWSPVNTLYVIIRYLVLVIRIVELVFYANVFGLIQPSPTQCTAWMRFEAAGGQVLFFCIEIVLILRVYAFYGRSKPLLFCILALFTLETASRITILAITMPKILITPSHLAPNLHAGACLVVKDPKLFSSYWVPGLIFESILFLLVSVQFLRTKLRSEANSPPIVTVFFRDGAWAFTLIFALLLWNTFTFELTPVKGDVALTWLYSVLGFCGTRVILSLRSFAAEQKGMTTDEGIELDFKRSHTTGMASTTAYTKTASSTTVGELKYEAW